MKYNTCFHEWCLRHALLPIIQTRLISEEHSVYECTVNVKDFSPSLAKKSFAMTKDIAIEKTVREFLLGLVKIGKLKQSDLPSSGDAPVGWDDGYYFKYDIHHTWATIASRVVVNQGGERVLNGNKRPEYEGSLTAHKMKLIRMEIETQLYKGDPELYGNWTIENSVKKLKDYVAAKKVPIEYENFTREVECPSRYSLVIRLHVDGLVCPLIGNAVECQSKSYARKTASLIVVRQLYFWGFIEESEDKPKTKQLEPGYNSVKLCNSEESSMKTSSKRSRYRSSNDSDSNRSTKRYRSKYRTDFDDSSEFTSCNFDSGTYDNSSHRNDNSRPSNDYSSQRNDYSSHSAYYPSRSDDYSSRNDDHSSRSCDYSSRSNEYFSLKSDYPSRSDDYSSRSNDYFSRRNDYPSRSDDYSSRIGDYSIGSDYYSSRIGDYSIRSDDYSSRSNDYFSRRNDYSSRSNDYFSLRNDYPSRSDDYSSCSNDYFGRRNDYSSRSNDYFSLRSDYPSRSDDYSSRSGDYSSHSNDYFTRRNDYSSSSNDYFSRYAYYPSRKDDYASRSNEFFSRRSFYPSSSNDMLRTNYLNQIYYGYDESRYNYQGIEHYGYDYYRY